MGFFGISSTLIDAHTLPGQTEGLKVGCGGKNKVFIKPLALGWVKTEGFIKPLALRNTEGCVYGWDGWFAKVDNVFLRLGGFAKVDNRFGYEKWLQGGSIGL